MHASKKKAIRTKQVLYGAHAIIEMLKAKRRKLYSVYTKKKHPKAWLRVQKYLPKYVPNIQYVEKNVLDGIAQSPDHMGVVALVSPFPVTKTFFTPDKYPFIVMLDGVQDVGNLGAILRSAYCAGVDGVVLCKSGGASLSSAVFKASAGLAEHLNIYFASSARQAVDLAKQAGYNMYMSVINGKDMTTLTPEKPICLVIGNEALGISKNIRSLGTAVSIPQRHVDVSYNASVAAGILLFYFNHAG